MGNADQTDIERPKVQQVEIQCNRIRQESSDGGVRDDFVPKSAYLDPKIVQLEKKHLWPYVWQVACREEEIPNVGSFLTYDIADESIVVVRTENGLRAYHNVCPHRGRPLTHGCGHMAHFACRYHGWRFDLNGRNLQVVDRADWGDTLTDEDIALRSVKVGVWGGFVFINMDQASEPLEQYLAPFNDLCAKYDFSKMRFRWYRTVVFPANWKTVLEGFDEAYHVQTTHPQIIRWIEDYTNSGSYGIHSAFWYDPLPSGVSRYKRSSRLGELGENPDYRKFIVDYAREMHEQLGGAITPRAFEAALKMNETLPATASSMEVVQTWRKLWEEAARSDEAGWPDLTVAEILAARQDWHIFPNSVFLLSGLDGLLYYRARPYGDDPDKCYFDVWSLARYGPGQEPPLKREFYKDWRDREWGRILTQDFQNLEHVQRGMKSRAFDGSRTNPIQEKPVSNFHRNLWRLLNAEKTQD